MQLPWLQPTVPKPEPESSLPVRHVSQGGLDLIKRHEGFRSDAYLCPANYWTIGYGTLLRGFDPQQDTRRAMAGNPYPSGISMATGERLLISGVMRFERDVRRLCPVPLTQGQFDALVSFTYNLGAGALQRSSLRRKVLRGEHEDVPEEFARWVYAGGRKLPGLVRRRREEADLYASQA